MSTEYLQVEAWLKYYDYPEGKTDSDMSEMTLEVIGDLRAQISSGTVRCNSGHETARALWNCPVCTDGLHKEIDRLKKIIAQCPNENDNLGSEFTHVQILKSRNEELQAALELLVVTCQERGLAENPSTENAVEVLKGFDGL